MKVKNAVTTSLFTTLLFILAAVLPTENALGVTLEQSKFVDVKIEFNNQFLTIKSIENSTSTTANITNSQGQSYKMRVLDGQGGTLYETYFTPTTQIRFEDFSGKSTQDSVLNIQNGSLTITIPLNPTTKKIEIVDIRGNIVSAQEIPNQINETLQKPTQPLESKVTITKAIGVILAVILIISAGLFLLLRFKKQRANKAKAPTY